MYIERERERVEYFLATVRERKVRIALEIFRRGSTQIG